MTKIVSIHSFRGGTGKSNITANLAAQVALAGYRVAVVDTDIYSPGIHVPFGLDEHSMGRTLNQYLRSECDIQDVAFSIGENTGEAVGRKQLAGKTLWLLPSSISSNEIAQVLRDGYDVNRLNEGIQTLGKKMKIDYLFIDTHPGINEETLLSFIITDILLIVLRPDQQDFQGTAVTVDLASGLDVPTMYLVVNKALSRYDPNQIRQEVIDKYHLPAAGVLPLTEDLAGLGSADIFSLVKPDHPWSRSLRSIAQVVLETK